MTKYKKTRPINTTGLATPPLDKLSNKSKGLLSAVSSVEEETALDFIISDVLSTAKTIAVVGASANWKRPSYFVMKYLKKHGYKIIPINPKSPGRKILGEICYASLDEVSDQIDIVDVFRPSDECMEIVKSAISIQAKVIWMQVGIKNSEAADVAIKSGLKVIMNRCPKIEHTRLSGLLGLGGFDSGFISARRTPVVAPAKAPRNGGLFKTMNAETLAVHAGTRPDAASGARNMPIYQTTAYTFDDSDHAESLFNLQEPGNVYGRMSNPTTAALEQRLAALDNAVGACCVSSGHAAQLMALYPLMSSGKKLVASSNLYGGSITQFSKAFKSFGWDAELVDVSNFTEVSRAVSDPNVVGLFIESLANPDGNVSDLEKLADIAHEAGIPLIVDNTMATPILCQPGGFGADLVVYSTTKFLSGHGNAMGGAVVDTGKFDWLKGRDFPCLNSPDEAYHGITFTETFGPLAFITFCHARILRDLGSTMSPFNAYLTLLGLETLPLRMVKHMTNAEAIARFLVSHKKVKSVSWAGLDTSPYYDLSRKYMQKGSGSVFTFSIVGRAKDALKVIDSCNLFSHVSNIGDTRSLINHPASTTHRQLSVEQLVACGLTDTTIRVSIGIENEADLINDLEGALDTI